MKKIWIVLLFTLAFSLTLAGSALASSTLSAQGDEGPPTQPVVARVYFTSRADLDSLAAELDIWEVNHQAGYLVAMLTPARYAALEGAGYHLEIDAAKTATVNQPLIPLLGQGPEGIPGYPCYRTVEETYTSIWDLEQAYPNLVMTTTYGESWEKVTPGGLPGYDLYVIRMTNEAIPGPKPTFFLMAEIHARELVTAEAAMRFAEFLASNYGTNPDITWLLDYYEIHIVPMTNPDGRKNAETGDWWRKNTDSDDGCGDPGSWGTDLNRNHPFHWGGAGTSPCGDTYQGPSAGSEPEVQAVQNYVLTILPDQRGGGDTDPAPVDTTGVFITLHSYSQLVLWPWGWTGTDAPNHVQLQTFGRRMAYFNNYTPQQSNELYGTTGTSDDWAYGVLGVAAYTFEMGTNFFQDCGSFESTIWPTNRAALLAAFKSARHPYMEPAGPESIGPMVTPAIFTPGEDVVLTASANNTRYNNSHGTEPTQNIAEARYSINELYWKPGATTYPMAPTDGNFDSKVEGIRATLDSSQMLGSYTFYIESKDANEDWGVTSAVFANVPVGLWPNADGTVEPAGTVVTYAMEVGNGENTPKTYDIQVDSQWSYTAPATLGPILPGERLAFDVVITIPLTATHGETDIAVVTAVSQDNASVLDSSVLSTAALYYAPDLSPEYLTLGSYPGDVVTYTLQLTNIGTLSDSFDLTGSALWTTTLPAAVIGPLLPGEAASLEVTVAIPLDAQPGDSDLATITALSQANPSQVVTSTLDTVALFRGPLVDPSSAAASGDPGAVVTYTLTVTNSGDFSDTYNITSLQADWTAEFPATVGPLAPDQQTTLLVSVTVPTDALAGAVGVTTLQFSSEQPGTFQNEAQLLTSANAIYSLELADASQSQTVYGDAVPVTYTLQVTNTGNATDTFTIAVSSTWEVSVVSTTAPVAAGQSTWLTVVILVPDGLQSGASDVATLTITSQGNPAQSQTATLTTQVAWYSTYLPVTFKLP